MLVGAAVILVAGCVVLANTPEEKVPNWLQGAKKTSDAVADKAVQMVKEGPQVLVEDIGQGFMDTIQTPEGIAAVSGETLGSLAGGFAGAKLKPMGGAGAVDDVVKEVPKTKPEQVHHYASNKNQTYTPQFKEVANKYKLDLDDVWNTELLPHQGRHPNAYRDYVLENMKQFDNIARGNKDTFMRLYESMKSNIKSNPDMLYKNYWTGK